MLAESSSSSTLYTMYGITHLKQTFIGVQHATFYLSWYYYIPIWLSIILEFVESNNLSK